MFDFRDGHRLQTSRGATQPPIQWALWTLHAGKAAAAWSCPHTCI